MTQIPMTHGPAQDSVGTRHPPARANAVGWKSRAKVGIRPPEADGLLALAGIERLIWAGA